MKRLMMMVAMMAFVLLLPMNAEAAGETVIEGDYVLWGNFDLSDMEEKIIINGDLLIAEDSYSVFLNEYSFYVNGNVYVEENFHLGDGDLYITGDYYQYAGKLTASAGSEIKVGGDFIVQGLYEECCYGGVDAFMAHITVEGDVLVDASYGIWGTIYAKGNVNIRNSYEEECKINLYMMGTEKQILKMDESVYAEKLVFTNQNVSLGDYINGTLCSDMTQILLSGNVIKTNGLSLNGYNMVIPGTLQASGNVYVGTGRLSVENNYIQTKGILNVASGEVVVKGDLKIQGKDEYGEYYCGKGSISGSEKGSLIIHNDLIIDTDKDIEIASTIKVAGDIEQMSYSVFKPAYVVLDGTEPQSVDISTKGGSIIDTLEIRQEISQYTFDPEVCWNTLIEKTEETDDKEDASNSNESEESEKINGLVNTANGFLYYEDGEWISDAYKFVKYGSGKFLVANGRVATHINGLAQDPDNKDDWYFLSGGQVQDYYTGLAQYDGEWFYVTNGKLDTTRAGFVYYDGCWFYVGAGRIMSEVNGLAKDPDMNRWYYLACGQAQTDYSGLAQYDGKWFYIISGILAENYTGRVFYDGQYFNVVNGMVK